MVRVLTPFKSIPPSMESIKKKRDSDKKLVDVYFTSENKEDMFIEFDIYPNYQNQWVLKHGERQKIPYALYQHLRSKYTKELDNRIDKETGERLDKEANKKTYIYQIELI